MIFVGTEKFTGAGGNRDARAERRGGRAWLAIVYRQVSALQQTVTGSARQR
jgi:hypothetical protein